MSEALSKVCRSLAPSITARYPRGIEYQESARLTRLGGFIMIYRDRCQVTLSTHLTEEDKMRGLDHLLSYLSESPDNKVGFHLWMSDDAIHN